MRLDVPLAGLPAGLTWLPGETWHFQLWHREPNSQSNTTDGATITFR